MNLLQPHSVMPMLSHQRCAQRLALHCRHELDLCHGDVGMVIGAGFDNLDLRSSSIRCLFQAGLSRSERDLPYVQCRLDSLPFAPCSLDTVVLLVDEALHPDLPRILNQVVGCLSENGHLLVIAPNKSLSLWCQIGMPFCRSQGMELKSSYWGDNRRLNLFAGRLARHWNDQWQLWLPFMSQWSLQRWQKKTFCGHRPRQLAKPIEVRWQTGLLPTSRGMVKTLKRSAKESV